MDGDCLFGCETVFEDENDEVAHYEAQHGGVVYVDSREKDESILSEVERVCEERNVGVVDKALESGDYVYHGPEMSVAIEYKSITDAVNSAMDGRLYTQADQMASEYDRAFVFIVGKTSEVRLRGREISYGQAYGQILGVIPQILSTMNMPVQWLQNSEQFADIGVRTLIDSGNKGLEDNQIVMVSPGAADDTQMAMLMSIDGVGRSAAKDILGKYGSLRDVKDAEYYELRDVSGIGSKTARKIYNTFNLDWDGPGFDASRETPMFELFSTSGVGSHVFYDLWDETDGLSEDPWPYIEDELEDELGSHRYGIVREATQEYLDSVDSPYA